MKEPTIEQKAKRFDEVLAMAKECITYVPDDAVNKYMLNMFPELRESGDERIRKAIIEEFRVKGIGGREDKFFRNGIKIKDAIAWLEKQGTSYTKMDVDDAYLKGVTDTKNEIEKQYEANYQIRKDIATFIFNYRGDIKDRAKWMNYLGIKVSFVEKQDEQKPQGKTALEAVNEEKVDNQNCVKPTDKVEPKFNFKVGQWIVATGKCVYLISKIDFFAVTLVDTNGDEYVFDVSSLDDAHQWTLADAKDGDVLVNIDDKRPFIYKGCLDINHPNSPVAYCGIDSEDCLCISRTDYNHWWTGREVKPATKEQRDFLMKEMADAGYTFDFEKKELKVKQKPTDEEMKELLRTEYEKGRADAIAEFQKEWSEEDEEYIQYINSLVSNCASRTTEKNVQNWLKDLKQRITNKQ